MSDKLIKTESEVEIEDFASQLDESLEDDAAERFTSLTPHTQRAIFERMFVDFKTALLAGFRSEGDELDRKTVGTNGNFLSKEAIRRWAMGERLEWEKLVDDLDE